MSVYAVTFRIADKTVNGMTYDERRQKLLYNAYEGRGTGGYWEETTSFFLVNSNLNTQGFVAMITKGLSPKDDIVMAFDPSDMSAAHFGPVKHPDVLKYFFRTLNKAA